MSYYPAGKKCKLDSIWAGPYLAVATLGWTVGIQQHPDEPVIFIHCQDVKKIPQPSGVQSWITIPPPGGTPAVPMLGASTVAHTSQDSPSVTALPPDEGVELADVESVRDVWSVLRHSEIIHASVLSEGGWRSPLTDSVFPEASPFTTAAIRIDNSSALHPFFPHKSDVGPVRLMTIAHAFNYRMALLRDGVKSAVHLGKSRKPEGCFLVNSDIPRGKQVTVMFQIVSTMVLELPSFLEELENLRGVPPNVQLPDEPWGHNNHEDVDCGCQTSDWTAAYVHDLTVNGQGSVHPSETGVTSTCYTVLNGHSRIEPSSERGRPGLVLFISDRPGAYGHLLLTVYVRWRTGVLVSSDWLRPVMRGGWRAGFPDHRRCSADVS